MSEQCYNLENLEEMPAVPVSNPIDPHESSFERVRIWRKNSDEGRGVSYRRTLEIKPVEMRSSSVGQDVTYRRPFELGQPSRHHYSTLLLKEFQERYQSIVTIGGFGQLLPRDVLNTIIHSEYSDSRKEVSMQPPVHSEEFSGRIVRVEGGKVLIRFCVEGDFEEREFARDELDVTDDFLKPGMPVVAVTVLKFLPPLRKPTQSEKAIALQELEQAEAKWGRIDISQVPRIPPIGS